MLDSNKDSATAKNRTSADNDLTVAYITEGIEKVLSATEIEAQEKPAALLAIGGALNGTLFNLEDTEITAGRSHKNKIRLEFIGVSRSHFKLYEANNYWFIQDTNSKNGTYVNNKAISTPTKLNKGDIIKVLSMAFKYLPQGDSERLAYDKLSLVANTDGHTDCFNKCYFNEQLEEEVTAARITRQDLSLIVFDLDHFKNINDTFGHDAGDYVLKEIADMVRIEGIREQDIFARYGGEEFVIILPQTNITHAQEIAERIRCLIRDNTFIYDSEKLSLTASFGIASYRRDILSGTDLFKRADEAAYRSKRSGRNQVTVFI